MNERCTAHSSFPLIAYTGSTHARIVAAHFLGALLPDIIDKPLWLLQVSPHGRTFGHSIFVWALFSGGTLWLATCKRVEYPWRGLSIALGMGLPIITDACDDVVEGLLTTGCLYSSWCMWPLDTPDDVAILVTPWIQGTFTWGFSPLEGLTLGLALSYSIYSAPRHTLLMTNP